MGGCKQHPQIIQPCPDCESLSRTSDLLITSLMPSPLHYQAPQVINFHALALKCICVQRQWVVHVCICELADGCCLCLAATPKGSRDDVQKHPVSELRAFILNEPLFLAGNRSAVYIFVVHRSLAGVLNCKTNCLLTEDYRETNHVTVLVNLIVMLDLDLWRLWSWLSAHASHVHGKIKVVLDMTNCVGELA